ncbi:MAG: FxsA family protein [Candidatus Sedimenticola sp. (ex Thyasira tokunagai)]
MNPLFLFLLIFVGAPLVELYFLIEVGSVIGAIPTIALTIFTAVLGGMLVRLQGFATAMRVRETMERGETPAIEVMEGVLLLLCGILLLLPGFLTDIFGFLCLVPQLRRMLVVGFLKRSGVMQPPPGAASRQQEHQKQDGQRVIEGEFHRHDE